MIVLYHKNLTEEGCVLDHGHNLISFKWASNNLYQLLEVIDEILSV
jgi:hypothetical protein